MNGDDSGFTLVEVSVTLLLIGIVFAVILGFLSQTARLTATEAKNAEAEQSAGLALRRITQDLRAATSISACNTVSFATCITFQLPGSTTSACPASQSGSQITYALSNSTVSETRLDYSASCTATTRMSGSPVISGITSGAAPLFTYYGKDGIAISDVTSSASPVPTAASVMVSLVLSYAPGSPPLSLSSLAAFRNDR